MSDTFIVTFNNGYQTFFNTAACFAPLSSLASRMQFKDELKFIKGAKPCSITYILTFEDLNRATKYADILQRIPQFIPIIQNVAIQGRSMSVTVGLDNPSDAVLHVLSAFRCLQECQTYKNTMRGLLGVKGLQALPFDSHKDRKAALFYLLLESLIYDRDTETFKFCYRCCHSNSHLELSLEAAKKFVLKGTKDFGTEKNYSDSLQYGEGWSILAGESTDVDELRFSHAARKDLGQQFTAGELSKYCEKFLVDEPVKPKKVAPKPIAKKVKKIPAADAVAAFAIGDAWLNQYANMPIKKEPGIAIGKLLGAKKEADLTREEWLRGLRRTRQKQLGANVYAKYYQKGYRAGHRINI